MSEADQLIKKIAVGRDRSLKEQRKAFAPPRCLHLGPHGNNAAAWLRTLRPAKPSPSAALDFGFDDMVDVNRALTIGDF
jgi:hypothetical protein